MMDQGLHTMPQAGSALRQAVLFINMGSGSAANKDLDQRLVQVLQDKGGMAVRLMRLEAESLGQQVQALGLILPSYWSICFIYSTSILYFYLQFLTFTGDDL